MRTFEQARAGALQALRSAGWVVKDNLKVPHATSPDGRLRLWFRSQAVHYTSGDRHELGDARNFAGYGFDLRTVSGEEFVEMVERLRDKC